MDTRRVFLLGIGVLALILIVALIAIFLTDRPDSQFGSRVATMEELEERGVIEVADHDLFVVWNDGEPLALSADAQHVPNELVVWCESSGMFESPAHGEKFDSRGFYYGGPARAGLSRYSYAVIDEVIYVTLEDPTDGPARGRGPAHDPQGPFCVH